MEIAGEEYQSFLSPPHFPNFIIPQPMWKYLYNIVLENQEILKKFDLENILYEITFSREKQVFVYKFNYTLELYGKNKKHFRNWQEITSHF